MIRDKIHDILVSKRSVLVPFLLHLQTSIILRPKPVNVDQTDINKKNSGRFGLRHSSARRLVMMNVPPKNPQIHRRHGVEIRPARECCQINTGQSF
jgi:hypothetical protein